MSDTIVEIETRMDNYVAASHALGRSMARHGLRPDDGPAEADYYRAAVRARTALQALTDSVNMLADTGHPSHALRLQAEAFKSASAAELRGVRDAIHAEQLEPVLLPFPIPAA